MSDHKPLILCVDDDPDVLEYLEIVLEAEGFRFAGAESAEQGLRVYGETQPDVIIVDLMMEEVDAGIRMVRELRLLGNTAAVFLLSSVGDNLNMTMDYSSLGLAGVFQKPLSKERLIAMIKAKLAQDSSPAS